jgi:hypothetical protein
MSLEDLICYQHPIVHYRFLTLHYDLKRVVDFMRRCASSQEDNLTQHTRTVS